MVVVNTLSQYLVKPRRVHLIVAKHVMRYLKCMIDLGLYYGRDHDYKLYGYRIQNGQEVPQTERATQVDVIIWDPP